MIKKIIGAKCDCQYPLSDMTRTGDLGIWDLVECNNCGKGYDVPDYINHGGLKINDNGEFEE